jgi:hypothetical protein
MEWWKIGTNIFPLKIHESDHGNIPGNLKPMDVDVGGVRQR